MNKIKSLLRSIGWWILKNIKPTEDEIDIALRAAFQDCGVNPSIYSLDLHLGDKKYEVLHFASQRLGNPLITLGDIKNLLQ